MADEETTPQRQHTENFKPEVLRKNFVPVTVTPPGQAAGHGVEGNHVPPTTSEKPSSPPPMPKKK
jgi:hypothetical protein